jgi:hypothetical protein
LNGSFRVVRRRHNIMLPGCSSGVFVRY